MNSLLKEYKRGDNSALERLMLLMYPDLYRLAFGYLKDRMLAEDIVSDTFIKLIEKIHTINDEKNAKGYLKTIVVNKSLNLIKKRKFETSTEPEWFEDSPSKQATDEQELVRFVLARMDDAQREVILLKSFGFTLGDIVEKTGYTVNQVRLLVDKGKQSFFEKYHKLKGGEL